MTDLPNRDELIELLDSLGNEDDSQALQAAREVHSRVTAAGLDWDELLVPEDSPEDALPEDVLPDDEPPEEEELEDDEELDDEPQQTPAERDKANAESLALIEKLLAMSDISADLREELEDYKTDIEEGEFAAGDRRYLQALSQRLSKR